MKTLNIIYILRICFGILAAIIATLVVDLKVGNPLINGISIGLAIYLVSYYVLKWRFMNKVEKPTKVFTMGIGAYFLTFVMFWVLLITPFLTPPIATFTIEPKNPEVDQVITFMSTSDDPDGDIVSWSWNFGDEQTSELENPTHTYTAEGNYIVILRVVDDHGISSSTSMPLTVIPEEQ